LGVEQNLREEKMDDWIPAVREIERHYFRRDDRAWGVLGVISARRWKDDVQYQAVRGLLAQRLWLEEKTLRRRYDERDYWASCPSFGAAAAISGLGSRASP
jgi:hypothetical protein